MRSYFEFAGQTRMLLAAFVLTVVLVTLVFPNLPINGEMFDLKPGYSHSEAMASMKEYGPAGRTAHAWSSMLLDTFFPLVYVTLFAGLIYRFRLSEGAWLLAFVPVVAGVIDLAENIQITAMLIGYPEIGETQVAWASTTTQIKRATVPVYLFLGAGLFLVGMVRVAVAKVRGEP